MQHFLKIRDQSIQTLQQEISVGGPCLVCEWRSQSEHVACPVELS